MFIREKAVKGQYYYQVVEGYRDASGRVRHRTIISLGQEPTIEDAITETRRKERRLQRQIDRFMRGSVDTTHLPATVAKQVERWRVQLAQQPERRAKLREVAKRLSG